MYVCCEVKVPLLIGIGSDFNVVTSDTVAMLDQTHDFIELHDDEITIVDPENVQLFAANGAAISREAFHLDIDAAETDKDAYLFYMLKEIDERPVVIRQLISRYLHKDSQSQIGVGIVKDMLATDHIYIVAGTFYHSGLVGHVFLNVGLVYQWKFMCHQSLLMSSPYYQKSHSLFSYLSLVRRPIHVKLFKTSMPKALSH